MSARCCARTLLCYVWASPCSLIGLLLVPAGLLAGASVQVVAGTLEVAGGRIAAWVSRLPRCLQFSAITVGHVILADTRASLADHRAHEQVHVDSMNDGAYCSLPSIADQA